MGYCIMSWKNDINPNDHNYIVNDNKENFIGGFIRLLSGSDIIY